MINLHYSMYKRKNHVLFKFKSCFFKPTLILTAVNTCVTITIFFINLIIRHLKIISCLNHVFRLFYRLLANLFYLNIEILNIIGNNLYS